MLGALALADVVNGLSYSVAGLYRSYLIMNMVRAGGKPRLKVSFKADQRQVSAWHCLTLPHNILFVLGEVGSAIMLTCVNLDRVIALMWPSVMLL